MIGTIGADKWNGLWTTPPTTDWNGADVKQGIANFAKALVLHQQRCLHPVGLAAGFQDGDRRRCRLQRDGRLGLWLLRQSSPQRPRPDAPYGLRLGCLSGHLWRSSTSCPTALCCQPTPSTRMRTTGLVDRRRLEGRSGSLQPAQGLHLRPHRLRSNRCSASTRRMLPRTGPATLWSAA